MISGGGGGRRYRPSAKAATAATRTTIKGFAAAVLPARRAQLSHRLPLTQARQPFRVSRSPHTAQKLGRSIGSYLSLESLIIFGWQGRRGGVSTPYVSKELTRAARNLRSSQRVNTRASRLKCQLPRVSKGRKNSIISLKLQSSLARRHTLPTPANSNLSVRRHNDFIGPSSHKTKSHRTAGNNPSVGRSLIRCRSSGHRARAGD